MQQAPPAVSRHQRGVAVREISCVGQCDGAPAISINDVIFSRVDAAEAEGIIALALTGIPIPHPPLPAPSGTLASDPYAGKEATVRFDGW